jgi:hypothetical protein
VTHGRADAVISIKWDQMALHRWYVRPLDPFVRPRYCAATYTYARKRGSMQVGEHACKTSVAFHVVSVQSTINALCPSCDREREVYKSSCMNGRKILHSITAFVGDPHPAIPPTTEQ